MNEKIVKLAMALWREQAVAGICPSNEADEANVNEWLANRTYPLSMLEDAANGDVYAIAYVRDEAGLSIIL